MAIVPSSIRSVLEQLQGRVFGYDYFISYSHRDAGTYAVELNRQLALRGFRCFLDRRRLPPGEPLDSGIRRGIRNARALLLVASPAALESGYVQRELTECLRRGVRIIPIDVGNTIERIQPDHPALAALKEVVRIGESLDHLDRGPAPEVLDGLQQAHQFRRESSRRSRFLAAVAAVLLVLLVTALMLAFLSEARRRAANRERNGADARRLALESQRVGVERPQLQLLLAAAAVMSTWRPDGTVVPAAEDQLRQVLLSVSGESRLRVGPNVTAADFRLGAGRAVFGTSTGRVHVLSLKPRAELLRTYDEHQGAVSFVRMLDDAGTYVSASLDGSLHARPHGGALKVLARDLGRITAADIDEDHNRLAVGTSDGTVSLLDLRSENGPRYLHTFPERVSALAFTTDGTRLIGGCDLGPKLKLGVGPVMMWDLRYRDQGAEPLGTVEGVESITIGPHGQVLVGASGYGLATLWTLRSGRATSPSTVLGRHDGYIKCAAFDPAGKWLLTGGTDGKVNLWELGDERLGPERIFSGHDQSILGLAIEPDGNAFWSVDLLGDIRRFDLTPDAALQEPVVLRGASDALRIAVSPGGRWLFIPGIEEDAGLWDVSGDSVRRVEVPGMGADVQGVGLSDGSLLAIDVYHKLIQLVDLRRPPYAVRTWHGSILDTAPDHVVISSNGSFAAVVTRDNRVFGWDLTGREPLPRLLPGSVGSSVNALAFTDNERFLLATGSPRWTVKTGH